MNKLKVIIEQTMMVSFMVLCYVSIYGLLVLRKYDYSFDWYIPGSIVAASFLCSLVTVFMLYGEAEKKEYSAVRHYLNIALHFVLLYGIIMAFGHLCYWYHGTIGFILTSVIYVLIYTGSWIGTYLIFRHEEKLISDAIAKIRDED